MNNNFKNYNYNHNQNQNQNMNQYNSYNNNYYNNNYNHNYNNQYIKKTNNLDIKKIIIFLIILALLITLIVFLANRKTIRKYNKDILTGKELIELCQFAKKENIKNNSKKDMKKIIKENSNQEITDEFIANYPNGKNSIIIKFKIEDKTYSMGEIIKIGEDKILSNYLDSKFKKETIGKHENGNISYLYYEYVNE